MAKLLVVLFMVGAGANSARADVSWNGSTGFRNVTQKSDDGLNSTDASGNSTSKSTRKRWEFRTSFGGFGKGEMVDWGIEMRTQNAPNSEWIGMQADQDQTIGVGQAYGRLHGNIWNTDWSVMAGRQKPVFLYDPLAQVLMGNAVRWDGFGWTLKHGMFGLNLAQYVQGAVSKGTTGTSTYSKTDSTASIADTQSHFAVLYVFQPTVTFDITDEIKSTFAAGYHIYDGTGASSTAGFYTNAIHGGTAGTVGNVNPVIMDNPHQLQLLSDTSLPMNFRFVAEWIHNKAVNYGTRATSGQTTVAASRDALGLSLVYGKLKKSGDYSLQYSYSNKGIASVITAYTNVDIPADNTSHMFYAAYSLADNFALWGKLQFHKEKAQLGGDGLPLAAPNNNRLQKQTRIEFFANVSY